MTTLASQTFVVEIGEGTSSRASRRVLVNAEALKSAKLCCGDVVAISRTKEPENFKEFAVGILWPSLDLSQENVVVSKSLQLTARLEPGHRVNLLPLSGTFKAKVPGHLPLLNQTQDAAVICLKRLTSHERSTPSPSKTADPSHGKARQDWLSLLLRESLVDLKYLVQHQILDITYEGQIQRFAVSSISPGFSSPSSVEEVSQVMETVSLSSRPRLWTVGWNCKVAIVGQSHEENLSHRQPEIEVLNQKASDDAYASVGGLNKQIAEIRDLLEIPLRRPELFRQLGLKPPRGILLHGPPGTGKTHLARAIASSTKSAVIVINGPELSSAYHGETESKLRDVFRQARERSPCIVVLDEVDALVPRREEGGGGEVEKRVVATLLTILDGMEDESSHGVERVVVIGTTNRPNAIDPALRRPGRFDREFEIGIPDAEARYAILQVLLANTPHCITAQDLHGLSARAHGYVGADLASVVREAGTLAIRRWLSLSQNTPGLTKSELKLTLSDVIAAMPSVRPTAMRSIFVETPPVRYSDIGGQASVIQKLREAVEWPLLHPEAFQRLGIKPPKGVLLYGPPGCSKTVLARACACESGVNFLAVKGPELLNKFVGESERAVREIFRKARAASPSIILFDEIDALGTSRSSADSDMTSSHEGVLTSLLNEMDGVQELLGVTIIAATNRPDIIDSALLRPGRLDRILYVGPPDLAGREEILAIRTRGMAIAPDVNLKEIAGLTDGYSGAEISALCQEAAILTMQADMSAPHVPHEAFVRAAKAMKGQITPAMLSKYERWKEGADAKTL